MAIISNGTTIVDNGSLTDGIVVAGDLASNSVTSAKIASSAVTDAKISGMSSSKLSGALPALDGSSLTNLPGGGKVLQYVSATDTSQRNVYGRYYAHGNNTLSVTITPASTSSKILINTSIIMESTTSSTDYSMLTLYRGSTELSPNGQNPPDELSSRGLMQLSFNGNENPANGSFWYLDSPSTTSATTYKVYMRSTNNSKWTRINMHNGQGSIIAMELDT